MTARRMTMIEWAHFARRGVTLPAWRCPRAVLQHQENPHE